MHSTLGVEKAAEATEGWMSYVVAFAKPFRMPDFFLISGLFLARVIDRDWRTYLDKKVVHFAYFYVLWLTIQFAFKAPGDRRRRPARPSVVAASISLAFIDPFGTIWFIYLLPIFFVLAKATARVPWWAIWIVGAALEMAHIDTGWVHHRRVRLALRLFLLRLHLRAADLPLRRRRRSRSRLARRRLPRRLGAGQRRSRSSAASRRFPASASPSASSARSRSSPSRRSSRGADWMAAVRYCGRNSIVIYLAFFLPMAVARIVLLKTGIITDLGTISLIVTAAGVICPLVLFWIVRGTPLRFLFERPEWAHLDAPRRREASSPRSSRTPDAIPGASRATMFHTHAPRERCRATLKRPRRGA